MSIETNDIQVEELPDLASRLTRVEGMAYTIQWLSDGTYKPMGCVLADIEWYSLAAIAKTTSNAHAFDAIIRAKNTIAATAIVRMQIEIAMRVHGLTFVDDVEEAGIKLMKGEKYSSLTFKNSNRKLTDAALHTELSKSYQWVSAAYEATCAAVHLDRMNIRNKMVSTNTRIFYNLAGVDDEFPDDRYYSLVDTFFVALQMTKKVLEDFFSTRPQPAERASHLDALRTAAMGNGLG